MNEFRSPPSVTLYTVGHSDRSMADFVKLLQWGDITMLVDVRAHPTSRRYPHFTDVRLRNTLADAGVAYHWAGRDLGGRRPSRPNSLHTALSDPAFRAYADHMESEAFQRAATQLVNLTRRETSVIMCAERHPESCHRSLIADYLILQGHHILHLTEPGVRTEHVLNDHARHESTRLVYDRMSTGQLDIGC